MKSHDLVHEIQNTAAVFGRNKEVNVVFEGERAYTDGNEIVLPSLPGDLDFDKATARVLAGQENVKDFNSLMFFTAWSTSK